MLTNTNIPFAYISPEGYPIFLTSPDILRELAVFFNLNPWKMLAIQKAPVSNPDRKGKSQKNLGALGNGLIFELLALRCAAKKW